MFRAYFKTEFKNSILMIKKTAIAYVLVIFALTAVFAAVSFLIEQNTMVKKITTAVVIQPNDKLTSMLIQYVSQTNSIREVSQIEKVSRDEAFEMLNDHKVNIVIDLPEDFYDDVNNGKNTPLDIYIRPDADRVTKAFVYILKSGVGYVQTAEATVYSFLDTYRDGTYEIKDEYMPIGDHIAMVYANLIMHRGRLFNTTVLSEYGHIKASGFYICALISIIMLYCGLSFGFLYKSEHISIEQKMRVYGMNPVKTALIREFVMSVHISFTGIITYLAVCFISEHFRYEFFAFNMITLFVIIVSSFAIASFYEMFYSIAGADYRVFGGLFSAMVLLILCSGMIIPLNRLPECIRMISFVNPVRYIFSSILESISGNSVFWALISLIVISVIQNTLGVLCRKY
jgi:hypothetical protein